MCSWLCLVTSQELFEQFLSTDNQGSCFVPVWSTWCVPSDGWEAPLMEIRMSPSLNNGFCYLDVVTWSTELWCSQIKNQTYLGIMFFFVYLGYFSYLWSSEEKYYPHMFISSGSKMFLLLSTLRESQRHRKTEEQNSYALSSLYSCSLGYSCSSFFVLWSRTEIFFHLRFVMC